MNNDRSIKLEEKTDAIVVIRYLPSALARQLVREKKRGTTIIIVLDDDLLDEGSHIELGLLYRWKLYKQTSQYKKRFEAYVDELWVASKYLLRKYGSFARNKDIQIDLMSLNPKPDLLSMDSRLRIRYSSTSSHESEWPWVIGLLEKIQSSLQNSVIEIVVPPKWRRRFRHIPRLVMLYPMDFETYESWIDSSQVDIFLVPVLNSHFGKARAHTKVIECARMHAVGLYSKRAPYERYVDNGVNGFLIGDDYNSWVEKVVELSSDRSFMSEISKRNRIMSQDLIANNL
ncbi:MAG: hypothetical protein QUV04_02810 [Synechococcus sp. WH 8007]|nr:hypothetical protein [Synechococcus sp. WH 8007]